MHGILGSDVACAPVDPISIAARACEAVAVKMLGTMADIASWFDMRETTPVTVRTSQGWFKLDSSANFHNCGFRNRTGAPRGLEMTKLVELIKLAFSKTTVPEELHQDILPETIRGIVSGRSHGNVRLQEGLFYTKEDVDEQYERARSYKFAV